jgi:hypothetical protein
MNKKIIITGLILIGIIAVNWLYRSDETVATLHGDLCLENTYNRYWCQMNNGKAEVTLRSGRADCITNDHAVETDWASKWKEGIGQSLAYSTETGKAPAILVIQKKRTDKKYLKLLRQTINRQNLGIDVFIIWSQC